MGNWLNWLVANQKWKSSRRCRVFLVVFLSTEIRLDLGNMAWFGVVDLTKFSIVSLGKLARLLVSNRKWKSRRPCRLLLSNFVPPESSFRSRKYGLFGVVDSTKFNIVAYAEIG